jgi:hypothetical protein
MEYNTSRPKMKSAEYGRLINGLIEETILIEDREARNKAAASIVHIMGTTNLALKEMKDLQDVQHKLWDHLFIMSDFRLDVDSPFSKPELKPESFAGKKSPYPEKLGDVSHYGRFISRFIAKASKMEHGPARIYYMETIANLMKKAYLSWNQEYVSDEQIREDLLKMSEGKLELPQEIKLKTAGELLQTVSQQKAMSSGQSLAMNKKKKKKPLPGPGFQSNQGRNQYR